MTTEIIRKLQEGLPTVGSWMQLPSSDVAEIMGKAGYDWVAVDLEHGRFSQETLPDIFRALESGGTVPFARVAAAEAKEVKIALDAGARGLIFPMIESRKQLEQAISAALYPPKGTRGVGYCRANLYGKHFDAYLAEIQDVVLVAQIEHINALQALDSILSVENLDAIMIGPYDLSASMGIMGQFEHPEFFKVLEKLRVKSVEHGIPMGAHVVQPDPEELKIKIKEGYQFLAYSIDATFLYESAQLPDSEGL